MMYYALPVCRVSSDNSFDEAKLLLSTIVLIISPPPPLSACDSPLLALIVDVNDCGPVLVTLTLHRLGSHARGAKCLQADKLL